jgi:formylglycine-generating enzyme
MRAMRESVALAAALGVGCGARGSKGSPTETLAETGAEAAASAETHASADAGALVVDASTPCPEDMAYVETDFCPDVERRCLDMEHEEKNHLEICHAFAHDQRCRTEARALAVCIDRYEYPDRKGAHPAWMLDWSEAQATCESKGKRLCTASEWTAAC